MGCGASSDEVPELNTIGAIAPLPDLKASMSLHHASIIPDEVRHTTVPQRKEQQMPAPIVGVAPLLVVEPLTDGMVENAGDGGGDDDLMSCHRDSGEASRDNYDYSDPGQQFAASGRSGNSKSQPQRHADNANSGVTPVQRFRSLDPDAPPMQSVVSRGATMLPPPPPLHAPSALSSSSTGMSLPTPINCVVRSEEEAGIQQQHEQLHTFCTRFQPPPVGVGPIRAPATPHAHNASASGELMFTPNRSRGGTPIGGTTKRASTSSRSMFARATTLDAETPCRLSSSVSAVGGTQPSWNTSCDDQVVVATTTASIGGRRETETDTPPATPTATTYDDAMGENVYRSPIKQKAKSIRSRNNSGAPSANRGRSNSPSLVSTTLDSVMLRNPERSLTTSFSDVYHHPPSKRPSDDGTGAPSASASSRVAPTPPAYEFSFEQLGRPSW